MLGHLHYRRETVNVITMAGLRSPIAANAKVRPVVLLVLLAVVISTVHCLPLSETRPDESTSSLPKAVLGEMSFDFLSSTQQPSAYKRMVE